jgi:hypothetical protein
VALLRGEYKMLNKEQIEEWISNAILEDVIESNNGIDTTRLASYIDLMYNVDAVLLGLEIETLIDEEEEAYVGEYESEADFAEQMSHELGIIMSDDVVTWLEIDWDGTYDKTFQWDYNNDGKYYWRNV